MTERITKAPLKAPERSDITTEVPREATPIELPQTWQEPNFWERTGDWLSARWLDVRFLVGITPPTVSLFWSLKVMNNDKKTTILGWVKGILRIAATVFFAEHVQEWGINVDEVVLTVVTAIGAVWGVVDIVMGIITNKADKEPAKTQT